METSSNQLKTYDYTAREEKYKLSSLLSEVVIWTYDSDGIKNEMYKLIDISKFGLKFSSKSAFLEFKPGYPIELNIFDGDIPISKKIQGILIYEKNEDDNYFYGVCFKRPIEINSIRSIFHNICEFSMLFSHGKAENINPKTIKFVDETETLARRLSLQLKTLEADLQMYGYEESFNNKEDVLISILYRRFEPFLNFLLKGSNELYNELPELERQINFSYIRKHFYDILINEPLSKRSMEKPLGYAGDFEMMQCIYRAKNEGSNLLGKILHKWFLNFHSAQCVVNRRDFFYKLIKNKLEKKSSEKVKVLSVASGPASEIVDIINNCSVDLIDKLEVTLLEQDPRAITEARHNIRVASLKSNKKITVNFMNQELGRALVNFRKYQLASYDLIYSAGLFDYVKQKTAENITEKLFNLLNIDAELYIGNFGIESPEKGFMEIVDWSLIYRTDSEILAFGNKIPSTHLRELVRSLYHQKFLKVIKSSADSKYNITCSSGCD